MGRTAIGNVYESRGKWYARLSLGGGKRPNFQLPTCATEAAARTQLALMRELLERDRGYGRLDVAEYHMRLAAKDPALFETIRTLGEKWTSGKLHELHPDHVKALKSSDDNESRLRCHVYDVVGDVPISAFTIAHADKVMASLPPRLRPGSRRHVAQVMHRLLAIAVFPLRLIAANPVPSGYCPPVNKPKARTYLYPDEDAKLLACTDLPIGYRLLFGFMAREGLRASEAISLTWANIDLDRGAVCLGGDKPRAWALDPGTVRALDIWRERRKPASNAPVFVDERGGPLTDARLADRLRNYLETAGVDRPELFDTTATRQRLRAIDLQATFITIKLGNGILGTQDLISWVQDRTGHLTLGALQRHKRQARAFAELGLGDMKPLDEAIPEFVKGLSNG